MKQHSTRFSCGLAFLRVLMCFQVIMCHCLSMDTSKAYVQPLLRMSGYAVPVFVFMSFYLTQSSFEKGDRSYLRQRLKQLVIPQIVWTFVYFIAYRILGVIFQTRVVGVKQLFWQLFTGHSPALNTTMWFQIDLIIVTLLIFAVVRVFKKERAVIAALSVLSVIALLLQYSGLNYRIFDPLRVELRAPLGRLAEVLPFASLGFICGKYELLELFRDPKKNRSVSFAITFAAILLDGTILRPAVGFDYQGVCKAFAAYGIMMFAYNCDFSGIPGNEAVIKKLTRYTLGIYCGHRLIYTFLFIALRTCGIRTTIFSQWILIYLIGYATFSFISLLPIKQTKYIM